jgi:nucleoside-diphosphate-sugar epimerase
LRPPRDLRHRDVWHRADLRHAHDIESLAKAFSPTHILHMAARTDLHGKGGVDYRANTSGVANLINACTKAPALERVIFASSRLVCRIGYRPEHEADYCPPNAYGESKVTGEALVRRSALQATWTIVRPTSIWGPWFDVPYKTFFISIQRGRYVHVRGHNTQKSFGFVGNTVWQLQRLLDAPAEAVSRRTFYLGDYPAIRVAEFAEVIRRELGATSLRSVPAGIVRAAALAGDGLRKAGWKEPPLTSFRLDNLLTEMTYDLEPLRAVVGQLPYSMEDGVRITVRWLRDQRLV